MTITKFIAIESFKSPIEVDIDEKIAVLENAHKALHECITKMIAAIVFDKYQLSLGDVAEFQET